MLQDQRLRLHGPPCRVAPRRINAAIADGKGSGRLQKTPVTVRDLACWHCLASQGMDGTDGLQIPTTSVRTYLLRIHLVLAYLPTFLGTSQVK